MAPWWLSSNPNEDHPEEGPSTSGASPAPSPESFSEIVGEPKPDREELDTLSSKPSEDEPIALEQSPRKRRGRHRRSSRGSEGEHGEQPTPGTSTTKGLSGLGTWSETPLSTETLDGRPVDPESVEAEEVLASKEQVDDDKSRGSKKDGKRKKRKKRKKGAKKAESEADHSSEVTTTFSEDAVGLGDDGDLGEDDGLTVDSLSNGVVYVPERSQGSDERKIAMFVDFENIALGVRDSEIKTLDVGLLLERLLEKGKIIVKRAYADWERYSDFKRPLHEAAIELIDIPQKYYSGKNSADIKMVVDAMDLCYSKEHLDTFVLVSGDSDFSPLVSKLKENDKYVIGLGVKNASSNLLIDNCDEFIYYEDVWRDSQQAPRLDHLPKKEAECFQLLVEAMQALFRENKDVLWGSMIKQTMKRKRPSFNEGYYGYGAFSELLQDAERKSIIRLRRDRRSGSYVVMGFVSRKKH